MASRVVMPKLTDTMEEGVLLEWKKREGDPVQAGEALAEIETDKAVMDLEAFASGILRKILVQNGETVESGTLLGVIGEADEDIRKPCPTGHAQNRPAPSPLLHRQPRLVCHPCVQERIASSPPRGQGPGH